MLSNIYDLDYQIKYENDKEYRHCIRRLFYMQPKMTLLDNMLIDEVSLDEMDYDETQIDKTLGLIFEKTKSHPSFKKLYIVAASKMISMNEEIGQAVLMSYDYLGLYHKCLGSFFRNGENITEENEYYVSLMKKIE